eukprot:4480253-Pleurochrysis_carterae.AAC.1
MHDSPSTRQGGWGGVSELVGPGTSNSLLSPSQSKTVEHVDGVLPCTRRFLVMSAINVRSC